jgi:hypothetical protein
VWPGILELHSNITLVAAMLIHTGARRMQTTLLFNSPSSKWYLANTAANHASDT